MVFGVLFGCGFHRERLEERSRSGVWEVSRCGRGRSAFGERVCGCLDGAGAWGEGAGFLTFMMLRGASWCSIDQISQELR